MAIIFPDNTVLVNFGWLGRMDLLDQLVRGNGRWCLTVSQECTRSSRIEGLEQLSRASSIFGDPLIPTEAEYTDAFTLRDGMSMPGDKPYAHVGEAETLAIITRRGMTGSSIFVTDDTGARDLALVQGIPNAPNTWDLLRLAEKAGLLTSNDRRACEAVLRAHGRYETH